MIKKLTMLAMAVGALVAFAVPAVASATEFTPDGTYELNGELSTAAAGGAFVSGPCETNAMVTVEGGTLTVDSFVISTPCPTSVPGCTVAEATALSTPWMAHVEVKESKNTVTITEAGFANVYSGASCAAVGVPTGVPLAATGDAMGDFNNTTHCLVFNKSGNLKGALGPVTITGEVCDETGELMVG